MGFDDSIPGFMKKEELEIIERVAGRIQGTIVECGSLWGRSSYAWADSSQKSQVVCIDTWELQFSDLREQDRPYICGDVSKILGDSFHTFQQNTQTLSNLRYIQGSSLADHPIRADLVFLDSAHTFDHLMNEFEVWRPRLNEGGSSVAMTSILTRISKSSRPYGIRYTFLISRFLCRVQVRFGSCARIFVSCRNWDLIEPEGWNLSTWAVVIERCSHFFRGSEASCPIPRSETDGEQAHGVKPLTSAPAKPMIPPNGGTACDI